MTSRGKLYFFEFAIQEDFMESSTSSQTTVYQSYKQVFPKEEGSIFSNTRAPLNEPMIIPTTNIIIFNLLITTLSKTIFINPPFYI